MKNRSTEETYRENFAPFVRPYYAKPLVIEKASGVHVWGEDGKKYLDAYCGVATVSFGHRNKRIDSAVRKQMAKFGHVSFNYESSLAAGYSERLLRLLGGGFTRLFFVNSGSEAVDLAILLARKTCAPRSHYESYASRRTKRSSCGRCPDTACAHETVFTLADSYHGGTFLSKTATGLSTWHFGTREAAGVEYITTPFCAKCTAGCERTGAYPCLASAEKEFKRVNESGGRPILVVEPILGVGGIIIPGGQYFRKLNELIEKYEVFLICDEVQTGFGRCGEKPFGFQRFGLDPDAVCMGKSIANGYPLGAVAFRENAAFAARGLLHFNTFGGNPLSLAAAHEVAAVLEEGAILKNVAENGIYFLERLRGIFAGAPGVSEVRGLGYFFAVEFDDPADASALLNAAYSEGLLIGIGGLSRNVIRIQPPLTFTKKDFGSAEKMLEKALTKASMAAPEKGRAKSRKNRGRLQREKPSE